MTIPIIEPKAPKPNSKPVEAEQIPTDPEGIKKYLDLIPKPVGYRMLVRPYSGPKKTKGGIIYTDATQETIQMTTVVGLVVSLGDLCYKDKDKFPNGPWCKEGEFVIYGRYAGARFKTKYGEHRILNDDEIIAKINQPEDILQLY
jgi:co-chaperonin GroES (HSP10)|tara:strand:+ start:600 stop:1034 length:435 start_codon:yes stop_codon:yes gene_type:complete